MRYNIVAYLVVLIIIQTLCLAQVECLAANWSIAGVAGQISQRDISRQSLSIGLAQAIIEYLKTSQAEVVFVRTPRGLDSIWFGIAPGIFFRPCPILPPLDGAIIVPVRETDAHLRQASLRRAEPAAAYLLALANILARTGPPNDRGRHLIL